MRVLSLLVVTISVVLAAYGAGPTFAGRADDVTVSDVGGLLSALKSAQPGATIHLAATTFPQFTIQSRRFSAPVTIVGTGPTTVMNGINIFDSQNLAFQSVRFAPAGHIATVNVNSSSSVSFSHVAFDGQDESLGANLQVQSRATDVSVIDSTFVLCGSGRACVLAHGTGVSILRNSFDRMIDSDGVRGSGVNVTITSNTFDHALRGKDANHNDFVQILGGGPWKITRNKFGDRNNGGGQVFLKPLPGSGNAIHDVYVASNIFYGNMPFAMQIGPGNGTVPPARNVSIVNNTILSGSAAAIRLVPEVAQLPDDQRPIIANNIEAVNKSGYCAPLARTTSRNLVISGQACPGDLSGNPSLGLSYEPTKASAKLIGQADPQYAPETDFFGHPHGARPDIGAIYFGSAQSVTLGLKVPASLKLKLGALARHHWKLTVGAQPTGATKLKGTLSSGGRSLATASKKTDPAARTTVTLTISLPLRARKQGVRTFLWTATGADGHTIRRTTTLRFVR